MSTSTCSRFRIDSNDWLFDKEQGQHIGTVYGLTSEGHLQRTGYGTHRTKVLFFSRDRELTVSGPPLQLGNDGERIINPALIERILEDELQRTT